MRKQPYSYLTVLLLSLLIVTLRYLQLSNNEISWDVFGYYLYLPSVFIHHDVLLNDISWIKETMVQYNTSGTLYQLTTTPDGKPMHFFLIGMSIIYLPFFFLGHSLSQLMGYSPDGFSLPYQYSLALGCVFYSIIGLIICRKILLQFFSDRISSATIAIMVLGTNYLHFNTLKNLETPAILFMLLAIVVWYTIQWHKQHKLKYMLYISVALALITLIKPSEVVAGIIPFAWGIYNKESLWKKIELLKQYKKQIIQSIIVGIIILSPELIYWLAQTGNILFDSYKNPGVGLDILSPHIIDALFSFRKGWLVYTPLMILPITGFYFLYRKNRSFFVPTFSYFIVTFYIIASWSEWWYGAGYSLRPMVTSYAVLLFPMATCLERITQTKTIVKATLWIAIITLVFFNLFQNWQFNQLILDPYRTTKEYYFRIFGKTNASEEDKKYLLVERDFSGKDEFKSRKEYKMVNDTILADMIRIDSTREFYNLFEQPFNKLSNKDHFWCTVDLNILDPAFAKGEAPLLVMTFERKEGAYKYRAFELATDTTFYFEYLSPEVRQAKDAFKVYIWNRHFSTFTAKQIRLKFFERLPPNMR